MNGRREEKPTASINPTLGCDRAARTSCGRRRAGLAGGVSGAPFRGMASGMAPTLACVGGAVQSARGSEAGPLRGRLLAGPAHGHAVGLVAEEVHPRQPVDKGLLAAA